MPTYTLDIRTATPHFPGIGRYVTNLATALPPLLDPDEQLILIAPPHLRDTLPAAPWTLTTSSPFSLAQQWTVPRLLRRLHTSVYHSPYYLMPYIPRCPTILTIYDLIPMHFPAYVSARARLLFRWTTALALRTATHIIAISKATQQDIERAFPRHAPITVIPLAADPIFHPRPPDETAAVRARYHLPPSYLLFVGSNKPHKNLTGLITAFARSKISPTTRLAIVGPWDPRYPEPRHLAEELGIAHAIHWLGRVPEQDLPALYSGALALVLPSLYEGFGLPALEAMACSTPVLCSNAGSLPEVTGDAALTVDPHNLDALTDALRRIVSDAELRAELRQRGQKRAAQFSWTRTARQTLHLYREIANPAHRGSQNPRG